MPNPTSGLSETQRGDRQSRQGLAEREEASGGQSGRRPPRRQSRRSEAVGTAQRSRDWQQQRLARGLGWFSIALGLAEIAAPRQIAKLVGVENDHRALIRTLGLREIAHGIGILSQQRPTESVWSRVGGDAIDLAVLGAALASPSANRARVTAATAAVLGVTALDVLCARQLSGIEHGTVEVKSSTIINRSADDLYRFWRSFENVPQFMRHVESVRSEAEGRSHWVVKGPAGTTVEWDAEIVEDRPQESLAWRTLEGSAVTHSGSVRFERAPGGRGTVVRVEMRYSPPGGTIGFTLAKLFGQEPREQVQEDLRRFKQIMEVGEVVRSEGSLFGTGLLQQRPAQSPSQR